MGKKNHNMERTADTSTVPTASTPTVDPPPARGRIGPQRRVYFDLLKDQSDHMTCAHCETKFTTMAALRRHIEHGGCPTYNPGRARALKCGINTEILQAVRDHMPSTILQSPEFLKTSMSSKQWI